MWKEKEYIKLLEDNGVDTVCFMGSGYHYEDYKIGQEFYFPYAYYAIDAKIDNGFTIEDVTLFSKLYFKRNIIDRYKLIKKYEFRTNQIYGNKYRVEKCLIQNLNTLEITYLRDREVDRFYWCLMAEPK